MINMWTTWLFPSSWFDSSVTCTHFINSSITQYFPQHPRLLKEWRISYGLSVSFTVRLWAAWDVCSCIPDLSWLLLGVDLSWCQKYILLNQSYLSVNVFLAGKCYIKTIFLKNNKISWGHYFYIASGDRSPFYVVIWTTQRSSHSFTGKTKAK